LQDKLQIKNPIPSQPGVKSYPQPHWRRNAKTHISPSTPNYYAMA
jgi:hypothetical protein